MTRPGVSMAVFSAYVLVLGAGLVLIPDVLLALFGFPPADFWVRVVGLLALALGLYYAYAALKAELPFYRISVVGRSLFFVGITALVVLDVAPPVLLLFGVIDLLAALWTWWALRAQGKWKL